MADLPRVLSRADALALGFSRNAIAHRLERRRWTLILPRTYLTSDTLTWPDRLAGALVYAGTDAVLSGAAALADTGLRSVASRPETILVLVPRVCTARTQQWVRIRRTDRLPERALRPGPARAPVARAAADLALELPRLDDVRALLAELVRRKRCTTEELARELAAGPRQHSARLRQALTEISRGAWSAPEADAATLLLAAGVDGFEQNARVDLPHAGYCIADFLWRRRRAILEIDSAEHHLAPRELDATMRRHIQLETAGYSVIHRSPQSVRADPGRFVSDVRTWLASRPEWPAR